MAEVEAAPTFGSELKVRKDNVTSVVARLGYRSRLTMTIFFF